MFDFNTFGFTGTIYVNSGHVTALPLETAKRLFSIR